MAVTRSAADADAAQRLSFAEFARANEARLRHALVASLGADLGREAVCEALAYGWEHWDRIATMDNPVGYLYRVGRSRALRWLRRPRRFPDAPLQHDPEFEPALPKAISRLPQRQRTAVMLIKGYGWTYREVADLMGVGLSTAQKHVDRALEKLRRDLGVVEVSHD